MKQKKRIACILLLFIAAPMLLNVHAFSDETFEMTIDSRFFQVGSDYLWQTEDGSANINVVVNNNDDQLNLWDVEEEDLSDLKAQFVGEIDQQMSSLYGDAYATVDSIETFLTKIGEYPAIGIDAEIQYVVDSYAAKTHQYSYTMTSKNYLYTVTFTMGADSENASLQQSGMDMINSFVILDEVYTQKSARISAASLILPIVLGAVIGGGIAGLLVFLSRRKKKQQSPPPPYYPPVMQ